MSQFFSSHSLVHFETKDNPSNNNNIQREVKMKENKIHQQPSIGLGLLVDKNTKQDQTKRRNSLPLFSMMKTTTNNNNTLTPPKKINLPPPTILFDGSSISPKDTMFPYIKHIIPLPSPNYIDENNHQHLISPFIPSSSLTLLSSTTTTSSSPLASNIETHYSQTDLNSPTSSVSSSEEISYTPIEKENNNKNKEEENDNNNDDDEHQQQKISNIPVISLSPSIINSKQQHMLDLTEYPILGDIDDDSQQPQNNESLTINHLLSPGNITPLSSSSSSPKSSTSSISSTTSSMIREQRSLLSPSLPTYDESTLIGKTLWKYKIDRLLGVGAFSKVYLATSNNNNNNNNNSNNNGNLHDQSAIKMISKSKLLKDLRMKSSIEREIAVLQFLHHPSIVQLQATMEIEKHICLLLEYVNGGELFDFVQQKCMMISDDQINEPLVQDLFLQLTTVVQWMHEQNVVHRDLKLENILLYYDNEGLLKLKITDFGLARVIDPQQPLLTTRCGSEEYTAPEIVQGIGYDGRLTDLWATGIILFAMLTGYLPFVSRDGSSTSLFYQIMQAIVRWPKDLSISKQAKQVVQSILIRQPDKRMSFLTIQNLEWFQS